MAQQLWICFGPIRRDGVLKRGNRHCTIPGCLDATLVVTLPVTVTAEDTDGAPNAGLPVYVFDSR